MNDLWGEPRQRTVTWYDPAIGLAAAAKMTGLEYVEAMRDGVVPPPPIRSVIELRLISVAEGEIEIGCTPDESLLNPGGLVHGGVLCTLMDTAMGIAVQTTAGVGVFWATIELKVSFLKPLPLCGGEVTVRGRVLKRGRAVSFAEGHAFGPDGTLLGHGTTSMAATAR